MKSKANRYFIYYKQPKYEHGKTFLETTAFYLKTNYFSFTLL